MHKKRLLHYILAVALIVFSSALFTSAQDEDPILIGGIHPLTGGLAGDGIQMSNAIQMAIAEINEAGGVLDGRMLEYLDADSTGSAEVGQTEAERLIGEGVSALIGTFQSAVTANVATIAEREQVPFMIDVAVADAILDQGFEYTFRIQPNATVMGEAGAQYVYDIAQALDEEINTIVYLHEGSTDYGLSVGNAFKAKAEELGLEVLDTITYDLSVTDLTTEMTLINALAPDAVAVTGYYNDGLLAARNMEEVGLNVKAVFGIAQGTYDIPQFVEDEGDLAECFFDSNYHWDASNELANEVREKYEEEFGEPMRTSAVLAYQVVYVLADAIERAESSDPQAIRDALAETEYADHILPYPGPIIFDETGENINAVPVMMQVQDGQILQVWPEDVAESEPVICTSWGG